MQKTSVVNQLNHAWGLERSYTSKSGAGVSKLRLKKVTDFH